MELKKLIIGMSGGVDSSVAAYLLKELGYDVVGVTMQFWQDDNDIRLSSQGALDAKKVADKLGIPHYIMDFKKEFKKDVIDHFISEYSVGRTPNPCVVCNRYVKWESLLTKSKDLGIDLVATGHYARIVHLPNGRYTIQRSVNLDKDQTYALYDLTQEQLAHTIMPIGNYPKDKIREIAKNIGLEVANKPDSQDICFVPDGDYVSFIQKHSDIPYAPGDFVDTKGNVLGRHKGIINYTIGQRKGLGIALGYPIFVSKIDPINNQVVLGTNEEILSDTLKANKLNLMAVEDITDKKRVFAKIRYNHKGAWCTVEKINNDEILCHFEEPQRAITPGQSVVLYEDDHIFGGGVIE